MLLCQRRMISEYSYSFREVIESLICDGNYVNNEWNIEPTLLELINNLESDFDGHYDGLPFVTTSSGAVTNVNSNVEKVWQMCKGRYYDECFIKTATLLDRSVIASQLIIKSRINKLLSILAFTFEKYDKLLTLYKEKEDNLLDQIKSSSSGSNNSTSKNRRNDTPQDGGEYGDDNHTTEIAQGETSQENEITNSSDKDTIIVRLNEIQTLYRNLLRDWSNELERVFYEEELL